ncbi:MAG TPA: BlaI/MecI/CopY family transcriptional regulator [Candidatus Acidoferrales bacterium]|nr:BlaI/MecI/CopY family transcriptional regulator [Candidatus Acidoferrales bacterium]
MDSAGGKRRSPRRAVLDLAPLELDCMNTLWPMGEGTVREIRDRLAERLPRAYTTIMTIMDRLARKGIVERCKSGRAYVYRANLSVQEARAQALGHVVEKFFGGSREALLAQLGAASPLTLAAAAAASTTSPGAAAPVPPTSAASEIEFRKTGDLAVSAKPVEPD